MARHHYLLWLIVALILPTGCSGVSANLFGDQRTGQERILLWHTWSAEQSVALDAMLTAYQDLNPNVDVISVAVPEHTLTSRLENNSRAGLGPDLILADAAFVYTMAENGLIRDLAPLELNLSDYLSGAVRMLSDGTRLFALPMSVHTHVLYYNRNLVETPPTTIPELMQRIEAGEVFAQASNFVDSYWGVGAYDGGIADSQRRLTFGLGGFTNWLDFLTMARTLPGFLLEGDPIALQQSFINGEAAYYVGDSASLVDLNAAMGTDAVGVALLPAGPNGGAPRPFLKLDALAFSNVSNGNEFRQALDLAQFLTGVQNQLSLATADLGLAPANNRIRLTPSLPENSLTVARQSRTAEAISFVNRPIWADLSDGALGFFDAYHQVTQGVLTPDEMVTRSLEKFENAYGLARRTTDPADLCPAQPATVNLWHSLSVDETQIVEDLARDFEHNCPGVMLSLTRVPADELVDRFREAAGNADRSDDGPDMLLESSRWLATLAEEGLLLDLTERVSPDFLQQFLPDAVENMRYDKRLYGIPESLNVLALYYNPTFVSDPPIDVQQLVQSLDADTRLALPVGFFQGYWGMDPFGGFEYDSYANRIGETQGLTNWLATLQETASQPGVDLYFDAALAEDAFAFEEAAYFVGGPWSLPRLRQELGDDRFQVVPLPNGPLMPGSPMLQVQGAMISANADELAADAALAFSRYLNLPASQQRLATTGNHVSAGITVDLREYPNIEGFREQAKSAALIVENSNFLRLEALGDQLYRSVLIDGVDPAQAVPAFVDAVHSENGLE